MSERRRNWEIHNLGTALQIAGIDLAAVHYGTKIDLSDLHIMLRNHGEQYFTHKPVSKVERFFLDRYDIQVEKAKRGR
jgi:hypothetical protein